MALIKCNECGSKVSDKAKACPKCGYPMSEELKKCKFCGETICESFSRCPVCYNSTKDSPNIHSNNKESKYIVIAWFFLLGQAMAISNEARNIYEKGSFLKFENIFELFGYFFISIVAIIIFVKYRKSFVNGTKRVISIVCILLITILLSYTFFTIYKYNHSDIRKKDNDIREKCKQHIVGEIDLDGNQIDYHCERYE